MAQGKRAGLITLRSLDRNQVSVCLFISINFVIDIYIYKMWYYLYEYYTWMFGKYPEAPTEEPKVELEPQPEPMVNIAQLETEQEIVEPVKKKKHKW